MLLLAIHGSSGIFRRYQDGQPIVAAASIQHEGRIDIGKLAPNSKAFTSIQRVITCRPGFEWMLECECCPAYPRSLTTLMSLGVDVFKRRRLICSTWPT